MTIFHKFSLSTTICFLALLIYISNAYALFDSNVDKAEEFMQAGMYPQAIALLEKEINDNPTNAEAHFKLGICYINQSNYRGADERFASAVRLNPDYGYKIGTEYKQAAEFNLTKGRLTSVRALYDNAIEYDPSLKKGIAQKLLQDGKHDSNDQVLSLAISYNSSLRDDVADYYYSLSQNIQGENSLSPLAKALQYSDKYRKEFHDKKLKIGNSFLNKAKRFAKIPGKDKETEEYKNKAKKYLGERTVSDSLPEYKIYKAGKYTFSLKDGEQTDHWIALALGQWSFTIEDGKGDKFKILYDDGDIINAWSAERLPHKKNFKFKIIAVTDQPKITMTLIEKN